MFRVRCQRLTRRWCFRVWVRVAGRARFCSTCLARGRVIQRHSLLRFGLRRWRCIPLADAARDEYHGQLAEHAAAALRRAAFRALRRATAVSRNARAVVKSARATYSSRLQTKALQGWRVVIRAVIEERELLVESEQHWVRRHCVLAVRQLRAWAVRRREARALMTALTASHARRLLWRAVSVWNRNVVVGRGLRALRAR